ncbi:hypothetical protein TNCV_3116021 [Trichonephila clavipes]|nr:hypothetical protein TNCV_3116021 [Trichonephila clavipes]
MENVRTPSESQVFPLVFYKLAKCVFSVSQALVPKSPAPVMRGSAFSQRSSSPLLIEDETFKDSVIINNLIDYEDGQEETDSLRVDKNMQELSFPTNWKRVTQNTWIYPACASDAEGEDAFRSIPEDAEG